MVEQKEASLVWPFLIIGVGIILSMSFVFFILKSYKKPHPLLIKPSSVDSFEEVSDAIFKSMFPMVKQGYTFLVSPSVNENELRLSQALSKFSPKEKTDKIISITMIEVKLDSEPQEETKTFNCKENNFFNLYRKKDKKWTKNIYFSICREREDLYIMSFATKYGN